MHKRRPARREGTGVHHRPGLTLSGLALAFSTGADLWQIAEAAGKALASSLVTPQAIGGTSGLVILGALALVGLRRLFESKRESP